MKEILRDRRNAVNEDGDVIPIWCWADDDDNPQLEPHDRTVIASVRDRRNIGRRAVVGPQYSEEVATGYPNGEPYYLQGSTHLSREQVLINRRGIQRVRDLLQRKQEKKSIA